MYIAFGFLIYLAILWFFATTISWVDDQGEYDENRTLLEMFRVQLKYVRMLFGKIW